MCVVRLHINSRVPDAHAAIVMLRGVVDQAFGYGARMMPELSPRLSVEGECVVGGGDEQDSVHRNGSYFKTAGARRVENPLSAKLPNVARIDFAKRAVTAAAVVSVVGNPVGSDRLGG